MGKSTISMVIFNSKLLNYQRVDSTSVGCHGEQPIAASQWKIFSTQIGWFQTVVVDLVGGLEHEFYDFPYIGNKQIPTDSYFSEG